ncbi:MAG: site-specific integrase [Gammaproteobacteria bacterium]
MGRKATPGLYKRGKYWHIEKQVLGHRLRESTGAITLEEAERYLNRRIEDIRQAAIYGIRPKRTFKEAATKFLMENQHKCSINADAGRLKVLMEYIGNLTLNTIHMGTLQSFINGRRQQGIKTRTINHGLQVVRRILNLAAGEWMDEHGLTWLASAPKIKLLPEPDLRKPYPISWDEQTKLFKLLPAQLEKMALFAVNTGCRDQVICQLRWEWEIKLPELPHLRVFFIPGYIEKNKEDRILVCNDIAGSVVDHQRGKHPTYVFTYQDRPRTRMSTSAWVTARTKAGLPHLRVHDLKHTFGRRLRAAGVSFEDRQDLLGHRSGRITTHYSAAELQNLYEAANRVCEQKRNGVVLTLLRNPEYRSELGNKQQQAQIKA